jgi:hypothetical protein
MVDKQIIIRGLQRTEAGDTYVGRGWRTSRGLEEVCRGQRVEIGRVWRTSRGLNEVCRGQRVEIGRGWRTNRGLKEVCRGQRVKIGRGWRTSRGLKEVCRGQRLEIHVRDGHGGGWSRKINAWHLYTLMVYL